MNDLSSSSSRTLGRYGRLQRFNVVAFYLSFISVFGGFAISWAGSEMLAGVAMTTGFALMSILIAEKYLVMPFLKCPSCRDPFFTGRGWIGFLRYIQVHNRQCVSCGLSIDQPNESKDAG